MCITVYTDTHKTTGREGGWGEVGRGGRERGREGGRRGREVGRVGGGGCGCTEEVAQWLTCHWRIGQARLAWSSTGASPSRILLVALLEVKSIYYTNYRVFR